MKTTRIAIALFALALTARAVPTTLTADFNSIQGQPGALLVTGGISFSSPTAIGVTSPQASSSLFGGGDSTQAISVHNNGWLTIDAGGSMMTDVQFLIGIDWNFYVIETGLLDSFFNWQAWNGNVLVAAGSTQDPAHFHGGGIRDVSLDFGFDRLLVSETGVQYQAVTKNGIDFTRGAALPPTNQNAIALDNVSVLLMGGGLASLAVTAAPDAASTAVLLLGAMIAGVLVSRLKGASLKILPAITICAFAGCNESDPLSPNAHISERLHGKSVLAVLNYPEWRQMEIVFSDGTVFEISSGSKRSLDIRFSRESHPEQFNRP